MKKIFALLSFSLALGFLISGCSGSGSSSTPATSVGLSMPSNISPVPTTSTTVAASKLSKHVNLASALSGLAATDPGTDYSNATTNKHVEEHVLSQFQIINTILNALEQTHYSDAANIGQGPYKVLVAWQDPGDGNQQGAQTKKLQTWVVDSSIIVENGQNVNQVLAWIQDEHNGTPVVITAKVKIYASPTLKTDGSYQNYGVWTLNATFGGNTSIYFAAAASIGSNGEAIIKFHDATNGPSNDTKAILNTTNGAGFGKISFPDFSSCNTWPCTPPVVMAKYVYDASAVGTQTTDGTNITTSYKDRTTTTDVTTYYGLYDAITGADVLKTKSFGFPVKYSDSNGDHFAYYGAWQGRHQLWGDGGSVPAGTTVTRQDIGPSQPAQSYTVATSFSGTLTKRTLVTSNLNNILNIPVNTYLNNNYPLYWDNTHLVWCKSNAGNTITGGTCGDSGASLFSNFGSLVPDPNNPQQYIGIMGYNNQTQSNINLVSDPNGTTSPDTSGPGFYLANPGPNGTWISTGTIYQPSGPNGTSWGGVINVNTGGSIYIEYTTNPPLGTNSTPVWVKKKVTAFNQQTWTPTFDDSMDSAYTLNAGQQYYLMNQGTNFVLTMGTNTSTFQMEVQSVANPLNATTFATVFSQPQWGTTFQTNYSFVTSASDPRYLYLVYNYIDPSDVNTVNTISSITGQKVNAGDIVTQGLYGILDSAGTQYNWDYASSSNGGWGTVTYLKDSNGYKLLDDPISLTPFQVTNANGGPTLTVSPMYNGWMQGLPDIYQDLRLTDWMMTPDIRTKVYNIPTATPVTDTLGHNYLIKPLNINEFLNPISNYTGTLNLATADSADLTTVPTLVDPAMGPMPNITTIKYSEGNLIQ